MSFVDLIIGLPKDVYLPGISTIKLRTSKITTPHLYIAKIRI